MISLFLQIIVMALIAAVLGPVVMACLARAGLFPAFSISIFGQTFGFKPHSNYPLISRVTVPQVAPQTRTTLGAITLPASLAAAVILSSPAPQSSGLQSSYSHKLNDNG